MKFTQAAVRAFRLPAGKTDHFEWDTAVPGFGFRLRGTAAHYLVQFRVGNKQRRVSLGAVAKVDLDDARTAARRMFGEVAQKVDPTVARAKAATAASKTFELAIVDFIDFQSSKVSASYLDDVCLSLREAFKVLHGLSLDSIERSTIATALRTIKKDRGPVSADRRRSHISKFFNWAIGEGLCENNPVDHTNKNNESKARSRVLTHEEFKAVWNALEDDAFGRVVKLLALTAQRRTEIGRLNVEEVDFHSAIIHLPEARTKNGLAHDVPLSRSALAILRDHQRIENVGKTFFGRCGKGGFSGWSKAKKKLDAKLDIPHWKLHDLRRTAATYMNEIDVAPHIVEAVLNHISGASKSSVAGVYNHAKYNSQKRDALDRLAKHVAKIVGLTPAKLELVWSAPTVVVGKTKAAPKLKIAA